jgi:cytochrome c peroxidase
MICCPALSKLPIVVVVALIAGGAAHAAALVGETVAVQVQRPPMPMVEEIRAGYRRPDSIPFPDDNPYTPEKAALGQMLYYDTRLSNTGALACASCHNPAFDYGDGLAKSMGNGMKPVDRRSPSIINSAWGKLFMWDGRAASLEEQALGPIESPTEMDQPLDRMTDTVSGIRDYEQLFSVAFPHEAVTPTTVAKAIATYERMIVSAAAPFDAWIDGDEAAIPDAAKHGFELFNIKARCASCHTGWLFTDDGFHDTGLPGDDRGRGRLFPATIVLQHAFKTPSLRDTARRGPYMHDGSLPTLEAVVARYNHGGENRPSQSELISPLGLSPDEQRDIVAFLQTLTSPSRSRFAPTLPR